MLTALGLPRARRQLRRARRRGAARPAAALPFALASCTALRDAAARDPRCGGEYATGLVVVADLHLAVVDLPAALAALNTLVALLEEHTVARGGDAAGDDRLADALIRRGDTRRLLGEYDHARADLDRAGSLAQAPLVRAGAHNASGILAKDTGDYDRAASRYRQAVDLVVGVRGPDHPDLAALLHNLAGLEHAQGRYEAGEPYARRATALRQRQHGPDAVEVAGDLAVLGALLAGQHRLAEAEQIFDRTLAIWTRWRGPDHYEVAIALHNLAAVHGERGLLPQAAREYQTALVIKRRVLGHAHPEVMALAGDLAWALRAVPG